MKTDIFKGRWPARARGGSGRWSVATWLAATLLTVGNLMAMPVVDTVTGGPWQGNPLYYGYVDGDTAAEAQFHTPYALALDNAGENLYVADRDNNAIRFIDAAAGQTFTFTTYGISKPVGVAVDADDYVYVLNYGNGLNGNVLKFDLYGDLVATNVSGLTNACGLALDSAGNLYITARSNQVHKVTSGGIQSIIVTVPYAGVSLRGIVYKHNGMLAVCDSGRQGIYLINPNTGVVTTNAGFHGVGDFVNNGNNVSSSSTAKFNQPYGLAEAGDGTLVVADHGNHRVKVVLATGVVTNLYGISSNYWFGPMNPSLGVYPGWWDGTVKVPDSVSPVEARLPVGVAFAPDGTIYTTEIYYHLIRKVTGTGLVPPPPPAPDAPMITVVTTNSGQVGLTWTVMAGATNYFVKRSPATGGPYTTLASTTGTTFTDNTVVNGTTYYYVVSASNSGGESPNSAEVIATPPMPQVLNPQIGYVTFPPPGFYSEFHPVSSVNFNNDALIVIIGEAGTQTFYEYANTLVAGDVPNPTSSSASAPVGYEDGLYSVVGLTVASVQPKLTIKAVGQQSGRPDSAIVTAQFQFIVGNPLVTGNNAAQFSVSDITSGAELWYTTDGSDPTNAAPSVSAGTVTGTNAITLSMAFPPATSNLTFKVRGFKANYQPSGIVTTMFSATNFNANKITFGFASGEASSDFVASAGQFFYAPVTLSLIPSALMYSLQFNLTVTNGGPTPGPAVALGDVDFESFLEKPIPSMPGYYKRIPPLSFLGYQTNPPPPSAIVYYDGMPFVDMTFINTNDNLNLLGVGWLERATKTNLYNTQLQDLIKYSQAHDTMFLSDAGKVVVGGYAFRVPISAQGGDTYQIQIGRPSATSDGIGAPGGNVYIAAPTNGAISALKIVTVGQRKYVVGDAAPFRWFNAGDFGNSNLLNDDVMQVFQSAIYGLNFPPYDDKSWNGIGYTNVSDFFDVMDSCGYAYVDNGNGYLELDASLLYTNTLANPLFNGSDANINQIGFGDGFLDVCDVYVTFRRSLDPTLCWFQRFWTNGVRAAESLCDQPAPAAPLPAALPASAASVNFASADFIASAGQTLQIPVTAKIVGNYPLRVLMLNLTVTPLDGSPALTTAVQFTPNPSLGAPTINSSQGNANYAATWLNNAITGLSGDATLGLLTVQIPAGANSSAAYAIRFEHASASPNGLASLPSKVQTGLITLSDRSASSWNDGIADAWRLRYFGSIQNLLSAPGADADGDGANNAHESKAGTDPNDAASVLRLRLNQESSQDFVIRWPSGVNKQYVVERSSSLSAPVWSAISTNTGTGDELEFHDTSGGPVIRFYRVRPVD